MPRKCRTLWVNFSDGDWRDQSAVELFELFQRFQAHHAAAGSVQWTDDDETRYLLLLEGVIEIEFKRSRFRTGLRNIGVDDQDIATNALAHLWRKTRTLKMKHPCWRVLLRLLYTAIRWYVLTEVKRIHRHTPEGTTRGAIAFSDFTWRAIGYAERHGETGTDFASGAKFAAPQHHEIDTPSLEEMAELLSTEEAIDQVVGDIAADSQEQADAIEAAYRCLLRDLLQTSGKTHRRHCDLPYDVQLRVCLNLHALILSRTRRAIERVIRGGRAVQENEQTSIAVEAVAAVCPADAQRVVPDEDEPVGAGIAETGYAVP